MNITDLSQLRELWDSATPSSMKGCLIWVNHSRQRLFLYSEGLVVSTPLNFLMPIPLPCMTQLVGEILPHLELTSLERLVEQRYASQTLESSIGPIFLKV